MCQETKKTCLKDIFSRQLQGYFCVYVEDFFKNYYIKLSAKTGQTSLSSNQLFNLKYKNANQELKGH